MIGRLTSFVERNPRRAATVILAFAIALCVAILGILVAIVGIEDPFDPPYPSEQTPLSWTGDLVAWTAANTVVFYGGGEYAIFPDHMDPTDCYEMQDGWGRNYSCIRFHWEDCDGGWSGLIANDSEQLELSTGVETTAEFPIGRRGDGVAYSLVVTDLQGNGAFDRGDSITFKSSPSADTYEDDVYTIALICLCPQVMKIGEFSFAFHDGEFYSWESNELDWIQPWWE
jgi:hypothetical protein